MAVDKLVDSTQLDADITSVANAIRTKGGTSAQLEFPDEFVSAIGDISGGGGVNPVAKNNDVVFVDFDGEIRYSYSAEEFLALSTLPPLPVHDGLVCEGWMWTLEDAKAYVERYWELIIGVTYHTSDDWDVFFVNIPTDLDLCFKWGGGSSIAGDVNYPVSIDWGDGSPIETYVKQVGDEYTPSHHLVRGSTDRIRVKYSGTTGNNGIEDIFIANMVSNNQRANIRKKIIGMYMSNVSTGYDRITCYDHAEQKWLAMPSTRRPGSTYNANKLAVYMCATGTPDYGQFSWLCFSKTVTPPTGGGWAYRNITRITLPEVTSIPASMDFDAMNYIRIPKTIETIANSTFKNGYTMFWIQFYPEDPPAVAGSATFQNLDSNAAIIVPVASIDDYLSATNYPSSSTYTYLGWYKGTDGAVLPTTQGTHSLTWYASIEDAKSQTQPITTMQGREVFCRYA